MAEPASGVTEGQFIELYNGTGQPQDLGGLEVSTLSTPMMTFTIPDETFIATNGYLVLGQSSVMANNGGAPVDVPYGTALTIAPADTVAVNVTNWLLPDAGMAAGPFTVNQYGWDAGTPG